MVNKEKRAYGLRICQKSVVGQATTSPVIVSAKFLANPRVRSLASLVSTQSSYCYGVIKTPGEEK